MSRIPSPRAVIDLNADLGEGVPTDAQLLPVITSASVACGAHAGDAQTMREAVRLCRSYGVGLGAHPSFPDRAGFGRRPMALAPAQLTETVAEQIRGLAAVAAEAGLPLQHVKAHGALYNMAAADEALAMAIGEAVRRVGRDLIVVALAGSEMAEVLRCMGLRVAREAFVDRGYTPSGTLVPRDQPGALVTDPQAAGGRAVRLVRDGIVVATDGSEISVGADTLCIHGDTSNAVEISVVTRHALEAAGITVSRMDTFL